MGAADRGNLGVESLDKQAAALASRHDPVVPDRSTGIEWLDIFSERREYVSRRIIRFANSICEDRADLGRILPASA
jgi:hypothetical protein